MMADYKVNGVRKCLQYLTTMDRMVNVIPNLLPATLLIMAIE